MNPAEPDALVSVIPTARPITVRGHKLWAVPHRLDEVRVLRNLGVAAPSPIVHRYRWPGRFTPFHAQRVTSGFATLHPRAFILNDMGTGKTLSVLWAFDYLRSQGILHRMVIFAPLSTLDAVWASEILMNFPHLKFAVLHCEAKRRLRLLADPAYDIYIVNHDGVKTRGMVDAITARRDLDLCLIDESSAFRTPGTDRFKAMSRITSPPWRWVWAMSATPTPNEPPDAWAQVRLVKPENVPRYAKAFKEQTMRQVATYKWVEKPDAMETVNKAMQPSIRFTREQCVDLPPTTWTHRTVELMPEQKRAYDQMASKLRMEHESGEAMAVNEADKTMKLVQIAAGAVYNHADGEPLLLPNTDRVRVLREVIEQAQGKVIVFVPFIAALKALRDELARHWPTAMVYGGTSYDERTQIFHQFQQAPASELRVLVANAKAMSHGLTLTAADTIVWFAPTPSHETFDQANHRIIRPSQKRSTLVVMLEGSPVERKMYKRLQERQDMQGVLLEAAAEPWA